MKTVWQSKQKRIICETIWLLRDTDRDNEDPMLAIAQKSRRQFYGELNFTSTNFTDEKEFLWNRSRFDDGYFRENKCFSLNWNEIFLRRWVEKYLRITRINSKTFIILFMLSPFDVSKKKSFFERKSVEKTVAGIYWEVCQIVSCPLNTSIRSKRISMTSVECLL